ncbi:hypothetical protein GCM10010168_31000 [Actinoplanes ianthinogenes]|uniref:Uncharacterized protein n=1 Tax=Actinoplanes ianthinogenes TaxID=122358 RepID=A0ABM7LLZ7_9ACTN|nr:hypothetical protein [Actinoplanes ianthinogenes]BCJ40242.1 hypothetical protein Aiant_08990 [Actinoplanes ianthinogenes]GGR11152.1 hypothetical protein GCM10010168_31000 [Actinoplanes ianthinogenes]
MSFEHLPPHEGRLETFSLATRRVIRFSVAYLVVSVLTTVLILAGVAALRSGVADPLSLGTRASFAIIDLVLGSALVICVVGLLVSTIVWAVSAHRAVPGGPGAAGYGGLLAAAVLIALSHLLTAPALVLAALQLGAWAALLTGVLTTRARARRHTGRPDLGGRRKPVVTSDDWDASRWDPEVHLDIERRRRPTD